MLAPFRLVSDLLRLRRDHGVPLAHGLQDFLTFRQLIRASRENFIQYRLHDRARPLRDRLTYLSTPDRFRIEYLMNPRRESRQLLDKIQVTGILERAGVPTPPCLGIVVPSGSSYPGGPQLRLEDDLRGLLATSLPHGLVCKPNGGSTGVDVLVFRTATPDGLTHLDGTPWRVEELWTRLSRAGRAASPEDRAGIWKLEPRVAQHPTLSAAVGPTLATARVVICRRVGGGTFLVPPIWKVPVSDCGVDNLSFSGWICAVDAVTGRVGPMVNRDTLERTATHPTTGAQVEGLQLPAWEHVSELVHAATAPFPALRSLGCDVGFTESGPVIIEINPWWGPAMLQVPHALGLVRGEFAEFLEEIGAEWVVAGREA